MAVSSLFSSKNSEIARYLLLFTEFISNYSELHGIFTDTSVDRSNNLQASSNRAVRMKGTVYYHKLFYTGLREESACRLDCR